MAVTLETITQKVQAMLEGEKKRRDVALRFVQRFSEVLEDVAEDIWGIGDDKDLPYVVGVWRERDGKRKSTPLYYRYREHEGTEQTESVGFYWSDGYMVWGSRIAELRGNEFWYAIQVLIEWVPIVARVIDKKSASREKLLSLICVE